MGWKPETWKLNFKGGKDKWLVLLAAGLIALILAFPAGSRKSAGSGMAKVQGSLTPEGQASGNEGVWSQTEDDSRGAGLGSWSLTGAGAAQGAQSQGGAAGSSSTQEVLTYERQMEERLKELLSHVEGVGQVEVMIVLKSSEEKVWRVDRNASYSKTQETDSSGGTRDIRSQEVTEDTILSGQGGGEGPLLEKEMRPEVSGVVVTASGGGSPAVQAEISAAVEALFDVPSHKIKVLKRAE